MSLLAHGSSKQASCSSFLSVELRDTDLPSDFESEARKIIESINQTIASRLVPVPKLQLFLYKNDRSGRAGYGQKIYLSDTEATVPYIQLPYSQSYSLDPWTKEPLPIDPRQQYPATLAHEFGHALFDSSLGFFAPDLDRHYQDLRKKVDVLTRRLRWNGSETEARILDELRPLATELNQIEYIRLGYEEVFSDSIAVIATQNYDAISSLFGPNEKLLSGSRSFNFSIHKEWELHVQELKNKNLGVGHHIILAPTRGFLGEILKSPSLNNRPEDFSFSLLKIMAEEISERVSLKELRVISPQEANARLTKKLSAEFKK